MPVFAARGIIAFRPVFGPGSRPVVLIAMNPGRFACLVSAPVFRACLSLFFCFFFLFYFFASCLFVCVCSFVHLFVLFECDRRRDKKQREPREKNEELKRGCVARYSLDQDAVRGQPNASLLHLLLSAVMAAAGSASGGNAVKRLGKVTGGEERRGSFSVVLILVLVLLSLRRSWRS